MKDDGSISMEEYQTALPHHFIENGIGNEDQPYAA